MLGIPVINKKGEIEVVEKAWNGKKEIREVPKSLFFGDGEDEGYKFLEARTAQRGKEIMGVEEVTPYKNDLEFLNKIKPGKVAKLSS